MLLNNEEYMKVRNAAYDYIRKAQYNAVVGANYALIKRNLKIGELIISKSEWGNRFIDNLAQDIRSEFPETTGFSVRNLKYMKKFASIFKEDDVEYIFDFVSMRGRMIEIDIEHELVENVSKLLLELGTGFAFVGEQYLLKVEENEFYIDLLFYNYILHCFVAIDLKTGQFVPEYAGKMNFYLSVLDDKVKSEIDNPSIGLILCKDKNKVVAEYTLKDMTKPIGVSEYKLMDVLPEELQEALPSIEDIESRVLKKYECE